MDDHELITHFEEFHPDDLAMEFRPRPGKILPELAAPKEWRTYHETLHRLWPEKYDHDHNSKKESGIMPSERIFLNPETGNAFMTEAALQMHGDCDDVQPLTLYRPDLRPIYGGPTLLEALWEEMDTIMERLMTGQTSEDGGDKFRAQELAWVLAIVTDPYEPSVDRIREETMARWNAMQQVAEETAHEQNATIREGYRP